jgi:hypothetical protein
MQTWRGTRGSLFSSRLPFRFLHFDCFLFFFIFFVKYFHGPSILAKCSYLPLQNLVHKPYSFSFLFRNQWYESRNGGGQMVEIMI